MGCVVSFEMCLDWVRFYAFVEDSWSREGCCFLVNDT